MLEDEFFPADLIVLKSSDTMGGLFIETKNLDGETNLKTKNVQRIINNMTNKETYATESGWSKLNGNITCELPNNAIYKFEGFLETGKEDERIPLEADSMLLRGCKLRNTECVYGVTIFTGAETKIMKNSAQAKYKFSTLEKMSNQAIALVFLTQVCLALLGSAVGTSWEF